MRSELHDKVDAREQLASEALDLTERAKAKFADLFEATQGDLREAIQQTMEALALEVENELTDLTTKAVRVGADGAKKLKASK